MLIEKSEEGEVKWNYNCSFGAPPTPTPPAKTTLKDLLMAMWGYFAQNPRPPVREVLIPIWIYGAQNPRLVVALLSVLGALALAIIPSGASSSDPSPLQAKDLDPTEWELALVSTPGSNISSVQDKQLAGGLDTHTLSSLYDEGAYRASQQPVYGAPAPNPFEGPDPFAYSLVYFFCGWS